MTGTVSEFFIRSNKYKFGIVGEIVSETVIRLSLNEREVYEAADGLAHVAYGQKEILWATRFLNVRDRARRNLVLLDIIGEAIGGNEYRHRYHTEMIKPRDKHTLFS